MPFITTLSPNNPNIYSTTKFLGNCLKNNNISGFQNIKVIQRKHLSPNIKKLLTKAEFGEVLSVAFNCLGKRCECCNYPLINDHYIFKNVQYTFKLKNRFTCDSFNLMHVGICDICKGEYIGETGEAKAKLETESEYIANTFGNHNTNN